MKRESIEQIVSEFYEMAIKKECYSCECYLGFFAQLESDFECDIQKLTDNNLTKVDAIHHCLGCQPCPPAEFYTDYLQKSQAK